MRVSASITHFAPVGASSDPPSWERNLPRTRSTSLLQDQGFKPLRRRQITASDVGDEHIQMLLGESGRRCTLPTPSTERTMEDEARVRSALLSRRSLLRNAALAAGGATVLGTTLRAAPAEAAAKMAPKVVGYQETPKGAQRCDNCKQFEAPASCKVVDGTINPAGWCKVWIKKPEGA
jgi:hypothetical protein